MEKRAAHLFLASRHHLLIVDGGVGPFFWVKTTLAFLLTLFVPNNLMCWKVVQRDRREKPGINHAEHLPYVSFLHRFPISHAQYDIQGHP